MARTTTLRKDGAILRMWLVPLVVFGLAAASLAADQVEGTYVEARTSDVFTGPCFANSEVNLVGREAVLGWRVDRGSFNGVELDGLGVVAVVLSESTLGDPFVEEVSSRAILLVDETASQPQQDALAAMVRELGGAYLSDIERVEAVALEIALEPDGGAVVSAGGIAELRTRAINHEDHLCGNEEVYYPPLSDGVEAVPGVTLEHRYRGGSLGRTWSSPHKRSAFVGTFRIG